MGKMVNRSLGGRGNKFQINGTKLGWFGSKLTKSGRRWVNQTQTRSNYLARSINSDTVKARSDQKSHVVSE